jgi:hypothetical protein
LLTSHNQQSLCLDADRGALVESHIALKIFGGAIEFFRASRSRRCAAVPDPHQFVAGHGRQRYNGPRQASWSFFPIQVHSGS